MRKTVDPEAERDSAAHLCHELLFIRLKLIAGNRYTASTDRHLRELVGITMWKHSEAYGKYTGCPYWTEGALKALKRYGKPPTRKDSPTEGLQHEHLVPRKQLTSHLFSLKQPTVQIVRSILHEKNIGVVVTISEHQRLPESGNIDDPWSRYRKAGLSWKSVTTTQKTIMKKRSAVKVRKQYTINPDCKIRILVDSNPKTVGSAAYTRFKLYKEGMTVNNFLDRGGKRIDIRWDLDHNYIALEE